MSRNQNVKDFLINHRAALILRIMDSARSTGVCLDYAVRKWLN